MAVWPPACQQIKVCYWLVCPASAKHRRRKEKVPEAAWCAKAWPQYRYLTQTNGRSGDCLSLIKPSVEMLNSEHHLVFRITNKEGWAAWAATSEESSNLPPHVLWDSFLSAQWILTGHFPLFFLILKSLICLPLQSCYPIDYFLFLIPWDWSNKKAERLVYIPKYHCY